MSVFGSGDVAVRALSGLFAVATLPLAWVLGRRRGGPSLGWLFTAVMAMSPFALRYATETRMYSLLMAGRARAVPARRRHRPPRAPGVAPPGRTRMAVRSAAVDPLLVDLAARHRSSSCWRGCGGAVPTSGAGPARAFVAIAVGGLLFVPWMPSFLYQAAHTGTPWAGRVRPTSLIGATIQDFGGGAFKDAIFVGAIMVALALLGLFGRAIDDHRVELDLRTRRFLRYEAAVAALDARHRRARRASSPRPPTPRATRRSSIRCSRC